MNSEYRWDTHSLFSIVHFVEMLILAYFLYMPFVLSPRRYSSEFIIGVWHPHA